MGVSEVDEASLSLDEKLLRFMEQLESLEEKRASFNCLIEQGWFSISKARYSMGNKQVSALQYASEIEPLVRVHERRLDNSEVQFCTERLAEKCDKEKENSLSIEDIGPQDRGVRRRNKPKKDITEKETSKDATSKKAPEGKAVRESCQNPQQDPLKWFGILVPQSLKQAQSSFQEVIKLSAEIATLQAAVLNTRQELSLSMKNKHTPGETLSSRIEQCDELSSSGGAKQEEIGEECPASESQ